MRVFGVFVLVLFLWHHTTSLNYDTLNFDSEVDVKDGDAEYARIDERKADTAQKKGL